jgi:hypothetical protein
VTKLSSVRKGKKKTAEAHNAQQRVQDALARGEIKKPSTCEASGKHSGKIQFSHSNYGGRLAGRWLCARHHALKDDKNPKGGGSGRRGTTKAR